ncbi:hypothetical protein PYCC9005_003033 [Savitreella phatthalungensis]
METKPNKARISRACESCRVRKIRCDGESPCSACRTANLVCKLRQTDLRGRKRKTEEDPIVRRQTQSSGLQHDPRQALPYQVQPPPQHAYLTHNQQHPHLNGHAQHGHSPQNYQDDDRPTKPSEIVFADAVRGDDRIIAAASFKSTLIQLARPCSRLLGNDLLEQTCRMAAGHFASTDHHALSSLFTWESMTDPQVGDLDLSQCIAAFRHEFLPYAPVLDDEDLMRLRPACEAVIAGKSVDDVGDHCQALMVLAFGAHLLDGSLPGSRDTAGYQLFAKAKSLVTLLLGSTVGMQFLQSALLISIYLERSHLMTPAWMLIAIISRALQVSGYHRSESSSAMPLGLPPRSVARRRDLFWCLFHHEETLSWYVGTTVTNSPGSFDQDLPPLDGRFGLLVRMSLIANRVFTQLWYPQSRKQGSSRDAIHKFLHELDSLVASMPGCLSDTAIQSKYHQLALLICRGGLVHESQPTPPYVRWKGMDQAWRRDLYACAKKHARAGIEASPICADVPSFRTLVATGYDFGQVEHAWVFFFASIIIDVCSGEYTSSNDDQHLLISTIRNTVGSPGVRASPMHNIALGFFLRCAEISDTAVRLR